MVKPSPRQKLGPARTEAARKALGVTVDGFVANSLVLDTDPLGRGVDYLTITRDGKALGELIHRPGGYGENAGDWHVTLIRRIGMKAHDVQNKRERFPNLAWSYDSGPHNTPAEPFFTIAGRRMSNAINGTIEPPNESPAEAASTEPATKKPAQRSLFDEE